MTRGARFATHTLNPLCKLFHVHVAFEGTLRLWLASFCNPQISSLGADELHVSAGSIEMCVVGDNIARLADHAEPSALGSAPLMSGNDALVAENVLSRIAKPIQLRLPA